MKKEKDPFSFFTKWYGDAKSCKAIKEANAMNLATSTREGIPSNRIVLLKDYSKDGFVFYTNLESRKGQELRDNPQASLCFYWEALERQVRIEGNVEIVSDDEADEYFNSRPLKSRIGAWASKQSRPMENNAELLKKVAEETIKQSVTSVKRPPFWSGFKIIPHTMEFWQKGAFRLHGRLLYKREGNSWGNELLYP